MSPSNDIKKRATPSRARWFISECVLLLVIVLLAILGLSLSKLRWDQQRLLVCALPLLSGFSVAAFAGSIFARAPNWIVRACIVWLLTFFFLFPESKVKGEALGQQNTSTVAPRAQETVTRQQRDDAETTFKLAYERFAAGTDSLSDVIPAHRQLVKVELDSCRTSEERVAVLSTGLTMVRELESDISARVEAGMLPNGTMPQVRQYRLEVEIALEKEAHIKQARYQPPDDLVRQQLDAAQAAFDSVFGSFWSGSAKLSDVISAHRQLTKVEFDARHTSNERIAVLTNALKTAQELESRVSEAYQAGGLPSIDVYQIRQYRVEIEIELRNLKSYNPWDVLWKGLRSFMRWDAFPKDYKALLDACAVNGAAALLIYFLFVLGLYAVAPARFVRWHEWIANAGVPFSERIAKTLAPFLLDTPHTLNAVVLRYRDRARKLFEDTQEVKDRVKWVPAPLVIDDEALYQYERPPTLTSTKPYVAGLLEFQTRLGTSSHQFGKQRSILSIEGPGGVGKSALAFQLARWASDSREDYKLARFPILLVLLRSLGSDPNKLSSVDEAAADSLRLIMDTSKISAPLLEALLRRKRILVLVDGVSELPRGAVEVSIRPDKGASSTRFLVVTSRLSTNLPEAHVIRPQGLTIELLDRVLDDLISVNVGSQRFNETDRETLRTRLRFLIKDAGESPTERQLPMIFIKLMIGRADRLLNEGKRLDQLPTSLAELVTEYTEQLLRNEQDLTLAVQQARIAAQICMGKQRIPAARSQNSYAAKGLPREMLDKFVTAGLMAQSGSKSDPFYKFALDPVAEQLDANRLVIGIRDASIDKTEIDELSQNWEELPKDFIQALRRAAEKHINSISTIQPQLYSKLWPEGAEEVRSNSSAPINQELDTNSAPESGNRVEFATSQKQLGDLLTGPPGTIRKRIAQQVGRPLDEITASELVKVEELDLGDCRLGNQDLEYLPKLSSLRILNLRGSIDDRGLKYLINLHSLRKLDLSHNQITGAGLKVLSNLPSLEELWLNSTPITDAGLRHLEKLTSLRELLLYRTQVTDKGLTYLGALTSLRRLSLGRTGISDAGLELLSGYTSLQDITLARTAITESGLRHLIKLTSLQRLYLNGIRITDAGLEHLAKLVTLQRLDLDQTAITNDGLEHLTLLTGLQKLDLGHNPINDGGLASLTKLVSLEELDLGDTHITDAGVEQIAKLASLKRLCLNDTQITDRGLQHLAALVSLENLFLSGTQITDDGLIHLTRIPSLQSVDVTDTQVTRSGLALIASNSEVDFVSFDTNGFVQAVLTNARTLAATLFKTYVGQAEADTQAFVQAAKNGVARAGLLYQQGQIAKEDFQNLIRGKKDLAEMHALKQAGLASAAIDTFVNGVIQIAINAAFAAIKL